MKEFIPKVILGHQLDRFGHIKFYTQAVNKRLKATWLYIWELEDHQDILEIYLKVYLR